MLPMGEVVVVKLALKTRDITAVTVKTLEISVSWRTVRGTHRTHRAPDEKTCQLRFFRKLISHWARTVKHQHTPSQKVSVLNFIFQTQFWTTIEALKRDQSRLLQEKRNETLRDSEQYVFLQWFEIKFHSRNMEMCGRYISSQLQIFPNNYNNSHQLRDLAGWGQCWCFRSGW